MKLLLRALVAGSVALGSGAGPAVALPGYTPVTGDAFSGPQSVWRAPVPANAAADPASGALVARVAAWGTTKLGAINRTIPIVAVPDDQPTVRVWLDSDARGLGSAFASVPLPGDAQAGPSSDAPLILRQPGTDRTWEFWHLRQALGPPRTAPIARWAPGGLLGAGTYVYRVTALSAAGETPASAAVTSKASLPGGAVTVTWDGVAGATAYRVYRGATAGSVALLDQLDQPTAGYGAKLTFYDLGTSTASGPAPPAVNTAATPGVWHAGWGGAIQAQSSHPGYYRSVVDAQGGLVEDPLWGTTASSLPLGAGTITQADLAQGHIDHAIRIALPNTRWKVFSWPAQRSDGNSVASDAVPEGAHFVLSASYGCAAQRTAFMRMVCEAAKTYGLIVTDKTGYGVSMATESVAALVAGGAADPLPALYRDTVTGAVQRHNLMMQAFPWSQLRLLTMEIHQRGDFHP